LTFFFLPSSFSNLVTLFLLQFSIFSLISSLLYHSS
jgi:hypothetical protein